MVTSCSIGLVVLALVLRVLMRDQVTLLPARPPVCTQPPSGLSVAEIAYLANPANPLAGALATVVDLAQRGQLRISVIRRGLLRRRIWRVATVPTRQSGLTCYEARVMASVVGAPDVRLTLSKLEPPVDAAAAVARGWLRRRTRQAAVALLVLWALAIPLAAVAYVEGGSFGLLVIVVASLIGSRIAWHPYARTALGSTLHSQVMGFRQYLSTHPLHQPTGEARHFFAAQLPHAIALGVSGPWLKAAREAGITEIDWLDAGDFEDALSVFDDFADSLSGMGGDGDGGDGGGD